MPVHMVRPFWPFSKTEYKKVFFSWMNPNRRYLHSDNWRS